MATSLKQTLRRAREAVYRTYYRLKYFPFAAERRRRSEAGHSGFLVIQIDALAHEDLNRALRRGWAPNLKPPRGAGLGAAPLPRRPPERHAGGPGRHLLRHQGWHSGLPLLREGGGTGAHRLPSCRPCSTSGTASRRPAYWPAAPATSTCTTAAPTARIFTMAGPGAAAPLPGHGRRAPLPAPAAPPRARPAHGAGEPAGVHAGGDGTGW